MSRQGADARNDGFARRACVHEHLDMCIVVTNADDLHEKILHGVYVRNRASELTDFRIFVDSNKQGVYAEFASDRVQKDVKVRTFAR
jgi:hypothetical protein